MALITKYENQTVFDLLLYHAGAISGLFEFLNKNGLEGVEIPEGNYLSPDVLKPEVVEFFATRLNDYLIETGTDGGLGFSAPAVVKVNGNLLTTVPAGATENVEVLQSSGIVAVGTINTGVVRVADNDITLNGGAFLSVKAEDSQDIGLLDQTDTPIVPLSVVGNVIKVDIPTAVLRSTAKPLKTGADISYGTGDDFNLNLGRDADFLTLDSAPVHNDGSPTINTTTFRFTDTLGGQTFADGIAIDWSTFDGVTVLGYVITPIGGSWNAGKDNSLTYTNGTFTTGWHMTNQSELFRLFKWHSTNGTSAFYKMNYPPFNLAVDRNIWTSDTYALGTTQAYYWRPLSGLNSVASKTTGTYYYIPCRYFSVVGITLT